MALVWKLLAMHSLVQCDVTYQEANCSWAEVMSQSLGNFFQKGLIIYWRKKSVFLCKVNILIIWNMYALDFDLQAILSERSPFLTLQISLKIKYFT